MVTNSDRDLASYARVETLKTDLLDLLVDLAYKHDITLDNDAKKHMYVYMDYLVNKLNLGEEHKIPVERIIVEDDGKDPISYVKYEEVVALTEAFKIKIGTVLLDLISYELEAFLAVRGDR